MKKLFILSFVLLTSLACEDNCENAPETCTEVPATQELCDAYFVRWFYNSTTNACTEIGYSGCEQYGFATQAECEACVCTE